MINRKSIQILRGGPNYDPSTSEEILLDGQPFYSKKDKDLRIGDGVNQIADVEPLYNLQNGYGKGSTQQKWSEAHGEYSTALNVGETHGRYSFAVGSGSVAGLDQVQFQSIYPNGVDAAGNPVAEVKGSSEWNELVKQGNKIYTYSTEEYEIDGQTYKTQEYRSFAVALGQDIKAEGKAAFASGYGSKASGNFSIALGTYSNANGESSVAIGGNNKCLGSYSAAIGGNANRVTGQYAFVAGRSNNADTNYQTVIGKYNANNADNVFEIGYGNSDTDRKNIFEVLKDGRVRAERLSTKEIKYTGPLMYDGENVSLRTGATVEGAKVEGIQSVAFGGTRYDYVSYNYALFNNKYYDIISLDPVTVQYKIEGENGYVAPITTVNGSITIEGVTYTVSANKATKAVTFTNGSTKIVSDVNAGRTATSAEGHQSFAAGGSVHAYGDWSVAFGKDNKAYQKGTVVFGGGNTVGFTRDEFNAYFWDFENGRPLHNGKGTSKDDIKDVTGSTYEKSYAFAICGGETSRVYGRSSASFGAENTVYASITLVAGERHRDIRGEHNFVSGYNNRTGEKTTSCAVIGANNSLYDAYSFLGGVDSKSGSESFQGSYNFTWGMNCEVLGNHNTTFGSGNNVGSEERLTNYTFVAGLNNETSIEGTALIGEGLRTSRFGQHVIGRYNNTNQDNIFEIGTGTSDADRKNAFEVLIDGRAKVYGAPTEDNDVVRKKELDDKFALIMDDEGLTEALDSFKEFQNILISDTTGAAGLIDKVNENTEKINQISDGDRIIVKETTDNDTDAVNVAYMKQYIKEHFAELMDEYLTENTATEDEIGVLL